MTHYFVLSLNTHRKTVGYAIQNVGSFQTVNVKSTVFDFNLLSVSFTRLKFGKEHEERRGMAAYLDIQEMHSCFSMT